MQQIQAVRHLTQQNQTGVEQPSRQSVGIQRSNYENANRRNRWEVTEDSRCGGLHSNWQPKGIGIRD
jgi:hypothetical protein